MNVALESYIFPDISWQLEGFIISRQIPPLAYIVQPEPHLHRQKPHFPWPLRVLFGISVQLFLVLSQGP